MISDQSLLLSTTVLNDVLWLKSGKSSYMRMYIHKINKKLKI